jgi:putative membrane protein
MPTADRDPRVYFAAERTLLAWLRTGLGIMAFGFVVARFGLLLRLLPRPGGPTDGSDSSAYLGAALVGLGVVASAVGALQFQRFCQRVTPEELPSPRAPLVSLTFAWVLVLLGGVLVAVLLA